MKVSKDIETKANQLLSSYFDAKGKSIMAPIDPIDILEYKGYSVDYVNGKYDLNIYGALQIERKTVEINDDVTFNDGMENFTIAHELGHIVLHASKDKNNNEIGCDFDSSQKDNLLEREADDFAAYLLMPASLVRETFYQIRSSRLNLKDNFLLRLIGRKSKRRRALNFASMVIQKGNFNVSKLAMINRLIGLGLINGLRYQKNNFQNKRGN